MENVRNWLYPLSRFSLGVVFVVYGAMKIPGWSEYAAGMTAKGIPLAPLFLAGTIVLEVLGGLAFIVGYKAHWFALAFALFLVPATLIFHDFWAATGPEHEEQLSQFLKNVAIFGGMLLVVERGFRPARVGQ